MSRASSLGIVGVPDRRPRTAARVWNTFRARRTCAAEIPDETSEAREGFHDVRTRWRGGGFAVDSRGDHVAGGAACARVATRRDAHHDFTVRMSDAVTSSGPVDESTTA
jgi:hypothetical protein